jgi:hypothetical protein
MLNILTIGQKRKMNNTNRIQESYLFVLSLLTSCQKIKKTYTKRHSITFMRKSKLDSSTSKNGAF